LALFGLFIDWAPCVLYIAGAADLEPVLLLSAQPLRMLKLA